jgi:hypothetical protein
MTTWFILFDGGVQSVFPRLLRNEKRPRLAVVVCLLHQTITQRSHGCVLMAAIANGSIPINLQLPKMMGFAKGSTHPTG